MQNGEVNQLSFVLMRTFNQLDKFDEISNLNQILKLIFQIRFVGDSLHLDIFNYKTKHP